MSTSRCRGRCGTASSISTSNRTSWTGANGPSRREFVPRSSHSCASNRQTLHDPDATSDVNAWPTPALLGDGVECSGWFRAPAAERILRGHHGDRGSAFRGNDRAGGDHRTDRLPAPLPAVAIDRRDPAQSRRGASARRAIGADCHCHGSRARTHRPFDRERDPLSRPDADRDACAGDARRCGPRSGNYSHAGVHPFWLEHISLQ